MAINKLHDEFHTLDLNTGWEVPAGYPSGIQRFRARRARQGKAAVWKPLINDIDANQVRDGDRVICLGFYNEKGEFQAASISKRLSQ